MQLSKSMLHSPTLNKQQRNTLYSIYTAPCRETPYRDYRRLGYEQQEVVTSYK
jgi:hypothetical protein